MKNEKWIEAAAAEIADATTPIVMPRDAVAQSATFIAEMIRRHFGESAPEQKGCACANEINEMYKQTIKARSNAELEFTTLVYRWLASNLLLAPSVDTNAERTEQEEIEIRRRWNDAISGKSGEDYHKLPRPKNRKWADAPQEQTCAQCEMERKNGESIGLRHHECADIPLERRPQRPAPVVESSVLPSKSDTKETR